MSSDQYWNPGPLGLLGFGMTTILLNVHNADSSRWLLLF